jgi:hypothetical protein
MMGKSRLFCMFVSALVISLCLLACGGGGGGDATATPTPVGTAVNLATVKGIINGTAAPGSQVSFNIAGSDTTTGQAWTGTYARASDGSTTFESNNVNKVRVLSTLTRTVDGLSASNVTTSYFLMSNNNFYKSVSSSGVTSIPITQTPLPDNARVGDFGNLMTIRGSNNTTETTIWKLEADYNGNSKLTFSFMARDTTTNVVTSLKDDTLYLDSTGNPYKLTMNYMTNSLQLTMSGNRSQ